MLLQIHLYSPTNITMAAPRPATKAPFARLFAALLGVEEAVEDVVEPLVVGVVDVPFSGVAGVAEIEVSFLHVFESTVVTGPDTNFTAAHWVLVSIVQLFRGEFLPEIGFHLASLQ